MSEYYFGAGGGQRPLKEFDFERENKAGFAWEVRYPGIDKEESWELDENPCASLEDALNKAFPHWEGYGFSKELATKICLELGLILGTGVKVSELEEE